MCVISVFNYLISIIILWVGHVECRICKWKLLSVNRTFVAASGQLTSYRDVESSFSYISPTNYVQVNFWQFDKGTWPRSFSPWNFSAPCIMRLKKDFLPIPKKALPISHPARQYFMISIVCCSFVRPVLTGTLRLIATLYANSTCEMISFVSSFLSMMRK